MVPKKQKHPERSSSAGGNALLMKEVKVDRPEIKAMVTL